MIVQPGLLASCPVLATVEQEQEARGDPRIRQAAQLEGIQVYMFIFVYMYILSIYMYIQCGLHVHVYVHVQGLIQD